MHNVGRSWKGTQPDDGSDKVLIEGGDDDDNDSRVRSDNLCGSSSINFAVLYAVCPFLSGMNSEPSSSAPMPAATFCWIRAVFTRNRLRCDADGKGTELKD